MAILQANIFSKCLMRTVTIHAVLPADRFVFPGQKAPEEKPSKTLYLLHGIFGNYTDWVAGTRIAPWAMEKNLAVIMPSGDNRFYVDSEATGEAYGEFIGVELPTLCEKLFHLSAKREDRYIAGLSMGGYGAIRNGLKYHDRFSYAAGLSSGFILDGVLQSTNEAADLPTHKRSFYEAVFGNLEKLRGSDMDYKALVRKLRAQGAAFPKLYLACGTEDFLIAQNRDFHQYLLSEGIEVTYEEGPGAHEWNFWDTYIKHVLDWLPTNE
ncbi:MAG TPA: alpha/beta hydrolase family protein [Candidatus Limiplasma sp.]|nr:alpha/beta hydrolase family protein [Candidatus Limiplasma sp.]